MPMTTTHHPQSQHHSEGGTFSHVPHFPSFSSSRFSSSCSSVCFRLLSKVSKVTTWGGCATLASSLSLCVPMLVHHLFFFAMCSTIALTFVLCATYHRSPSLRVFPQNDIVSFSFHFPLSTRTVPPMSASSPSELLTRTAPHVFTEGPPHVSLLPSVLGGRRTAGLDAVTSCLFLSPYPHHHGASFPRAAQKFSSIPSFPLSGRLTTTTGYSNSIFLAAEAAALPLSHTECEGAVKDARCRTVCAFVTTVTMPLVRHVAGTLGMYQGVLNGTSIAPLLWQLKLFRTTAGSSSAGMSLRSVVESWADGNGAGICDVVVGSGLAEVDAALVGSVRVPWLEPTLSVPLVTDRVEFPTMVNVLPLANETHESVMGAFGEVKAWCLLDDASVTGRAWRALLETHVHHDGLLLEVEREVLPDAHDEDIDHLLDDILKSRARYVFIAVSLFTANTKMIFDHMLSKRLHEAKVLVFTDELCASTLILNFPGALCTEYNVEASRTATNLGITMTSTSSGPSTPPLPTVHQYASYLAQKSTPSSALSALVNQSFLHNNVSVTTETSSAIVQGSYFAAYYHDTLLHYMSVAHADSTTKPTRSAIIMNVSVGGTGLVHLDKNGFHPLVPIGLYNIARNGSKSLIACLQNATTGWEPSGSPLYVLGSSAFSFTSLPSTYAPAEEATSNTLMIVGVAVGGGLLCFCIIAGIVVLRMVLAKDSRNNDAAPKDDAQPFAIVFTDIQSSTSLWAVTPQAMSAAVEQHHLLIRRAITANRGYEVKTIGDCFMVAFVTSSDAVTFALDVQASLYNAEWSNDIDALYVEQAMETGTPESVAGDVGVWNGVRVRIGIHFGSGSIVLDPVTKGYDYYGTVVNTASRVEAVGHGGQTLVTAAVMDDLRGHSGHDDEALYAVRPLGPQLLRGLNETVELTQLLPVGLETRAFPPLRLDHVPDEFDTEVSGSFSVADSHEGDTPGRTTSGLSEGMVSKAKTGKGSASAAAYTVDDPYMAYLRVVMSPLLDSERGTILSLLGKKWRIGSVKLSASALGKDKAAADKAMLAVAQRTGRAHQVTVRRGGEPHQAGRDSISMRTPSSAMPSAMSPTPFRPRTLSGKPMTVTPEVRTTLTSPADLPHLSHLTTSMPRVGW